MRIAQVAPLMESVPPKLYGGTERVVSYLTEELVCLGHDVTLFASGDSVTSAHLVPVCPESLRLSKGSIDQLAHHVVMLEELFSRKHSFDVTEAIEDSKHFSVLKDPGAFVSGRRFGRNIKLRWFHIMQRTLHCPGVALPAPPGGLAFHTRLHSLVPCVLR